MVFFTVAFLPEGFFSRILIVNIPLLMLWGGIWRSHGRRCAPAASFAVGKVASCWREECPNASPSDQRSPANRPFRLIPSFTAAKNGDIKAVERSHCTADFLEQLNFSLTCSCPLGV